MSEIPGAKEQAARKAMANAALVPFRRAAKRLAYSTRLSVVGDAARTEVEAIYLAMQALLVIASEKRDASGQMIIVDTFRFAGEAFGAFLGQLDDELARGLLEVFEFGLLEGGQGAAELLKPRGRA